MVADKPRDYQAFAASDLDWTLVRPPRLVDGPSTGKVTHDAHTPGRSSSIRRADLAALLADVLDQRLYIHKRPSSPRLGSSKRSGSVRHSAETDPDRVDRRFLDIAAEPEGAEPADIVVLHRVVCCYPDYERLLSAAAGTPTGCSCSATRLPAT